MANSSCENMKINVCVCVKISLIIINIIINIINIKYINNIFHFISNWDDRIILQFSIIL